MNYLKLKFIYICIKVMSWFAAKTRRHGEFRALSFFDSIGVNAYVPSYQTKRYWSDRIKKVTVPAMTGYVFFELSKINFELVNMNPFTKNIVRDIDGQPAIIKEKEIATLKRYLSGDSINTQVDFYQGQKIKINCGPFIYKKGVINKINCSKVIINIESINMSLILDKSSVVAA